MQSSPRSHDLENTNLCCQICIVYKINNYSMKMNGCRDKILCKYAQLGDVCTLKSTYLLAQKMTEKHAMKSARNNRKSEEKGGKKMILKHLSWAHFTVFFQKNPLAGLSYEHRRCFQKRIFERFQRKNYKNVKNNSFLNIFSGNLSAWKILGWFWDFLKIVYTRYIRPHIIKILFKFSEPFCEKTMFPDPYCLNGIACVKHTKYNFSTLFFALSTH